MGLITHRYDESRYQEFNKLVRELGYPVLEMFIDTKITDKYGNVISTRKERAHSWLRNAYNILLSQMACKACSGTNAFGAGYISSKSTAGTITYLSSVYLSAETITSIAGDITCGIVAGTSDAGATIEDYKLGTEILNGNTAGKLAYSATVNLGYTWSTVVYPNDTWTCNIRRYMNNNSGGEIAVKELGLKYDHEILVARDVLVSPDAIPDAAQYTVTYTIVLSYPA